MTTVNVLLNIPHQFTAADRDLLLSACLEARIQVAPLEFGDQSDRIDGRDINVLVTELVPKNLSDWPKLRFVQLVSAGLNHLVDHPIWQHGIPVATASGLYSVPIAQFGTVAVLSLAHRMRPVTEFTTTRQWPNRRSLAGAILRGRTVGILGYGSIGRECARQLDSLGMRIIAMSRSGRREHGEHFIAWPGTGDPHGKLPQQWFTSDAINQMLPLSDVLVVTAPRTPDTTSLIGAVRLAMLPRGAHVIVLSRGGIVDEVALADALRSGQVGAAWVDAFVEEPLPAAHPLFDAPNITLSPHMSGVFADYWKMFPRLLSENLRRYASNKPLLNLAHGNLGY